LVSDLAQSWFGFSSQEAGKLEGWKAKNGTAFQLPGFPASQPSSHQSF